MNSRTNRILQRLLTLDESELDAFVDQLADVHEGESFLQRNRLAPTREESREVRHLVYEGLRAEIEATQNRLRLVRRFAQAGRTRFERDVRARIPATSIQLKRSAPPNGRVTCALVAKNDGMRRAKVSLPAVQLHGGGLAAKRVIPTTYRARAQPLESTIAGPAEVAIDAGEWLALEATFTVPADLVPGTYFAAASLDTTPAIELWIEVEVGS